MKPAALLEIGLAVGGASDPAGWARVLAAVEHADALGLHSVWLPEAHFRSGATPSPLLALSAFAARTQKIRLGTTSLLLPIHDPRLLADEIATLDMLSGGRVELGVGRGFGKVLFQGFGVLAREKRDRFDASLDAILQRWSENRDTGSGLVPLQRPHPPISVAAFGKKGLLQAARRGLPYLASPLESLDTLAENLALHREHLPADCDTRAHSVPALRTLHVARTDAEAARVRDGLEAEAKLYARALPKTLLHKAQADVRTRAIVGTRGEVADALARYRERIGLDRLIVRPPAGDISARERRDSLESLVHRVVPQLA